MQGKPQVYTEPEPQPGVEPWLQKQWMDWVSAAIQNSGIKQATLAREAAINPSYINLMRKGSVPRRDVARRLGKVLNRELECLLMAGHIPNQKMLKWFIKLMREAQLNRSS